MTGGPHPSARVAGGPARQRRAHGERPSGPRGEEGEGREMGRAGQRERGKEKEREGERTLAAGREREREVFGPDLAQREEGDYF
uniref:Pr1-like protein n=1 Tax=Oryza sativa subsp. japonica TaxID=39947 RepID=Q69KI1_ORYSJ|nr:hypothetical protein [Oryza sativa Japonica Group]BAD36559.1 hypothetical protein [Oryza sativa Japonica Group]